MRLFIIVCLGALLCGCNMVVTPTPIFGPEDVAGSPLREGLWLRDDPDCAVDTKGPATGWPECADWIVMRDGEMQMPGEAPDAPFSGPMTFLITGGEPRILQVTLRQAGRGGEPEAQINLYLGFEALAHDVGGRVTAYRSWPTLCGPPREREAGPDERLADLATEAPFPGLTLGKKGDCVPEDVAALRGAAVASKPYEPFKSARWVRDAYP